MNRHKTFFGFLPLLVAPVVYSLFLGLGWLSGLGLSLRYDFSTVVVPAFLVVYLVLRIPGWPGRVIAATFIVLLFGLALSGLWASGISEPNAVSGLLPFSDASSYYLDARRLLAGYPLSAFSSRRPLFPAVLALLFWLFAENLQLVLAVLVALGGCACYLAGREVQRTHGALAGALVVLLGYLFYRPHIGTTLTENLGFVLGMAAFALLWRGANDHRRWLVLLGSLLLGLGLMARAGPFFVLPALALWLGWFRQPRFSWRWLGLASGAIIVSLLLNTLAFQLLAVSEGVAFSNFSYTLYGLAVGGEGWTQVKRDHPEVLKLSEPQRSQRIYELAVDEIKRNPQGIVQGGVRSWGDFFSTRRSSAFSFVGGKNETANLVGRLGLFALCLCGCWALWRERWGNFSGLLLAGWLGILLSVPFVPPVDSALMRTYAAAIPFLAALPAVGLAWLAQQLPARWALQPPQDEVSARSAAWLGVGLLFVVACSPVIVWLAGRPPAYTASPCPRNGEAVYLRLQPGALVQVAADEKLAQTYLPAVRWSQFNKGLHDFMYTDFMVEIEPRTSPPVTLTSTFNLADGRTVWLVVNSERLPPLPAVVKGCGRWSGSAAAADVFYADDLQPVGQ